MTEIFDIAKETTEILKYCDSKFQSKIPQKIIKFLEEMANESKIRINIDANKKISEQNISEECKDMISLLYYNYVANDIEREEILKIWNENEVEYQKKIEQKYNIDNVFKKKEKNLGDIHKIDDIENNQLPVVVKNNFWKRIFIKIMKFFNNKNDNKNSY